MSNDDNKDSKNANIINDIVNDDNKDSKNANIINDIVNDDNKDSKNANIINDHDYIIQIVNTKFDSEDLLNKKYDDIVSNIFDTIKNYDVSNLSLPSEHFDCIVNGGGIKGYYVYGSLIILKKMMDLNKIKIRKFIGHSAGAFLSVFIFSGLDPIIIRNFNDFALKNNSKFHVDKILLKAFWELMPENIHELINGKVSIVISTPLMSKQRHLMIDKFNSKLHLMQILHATSYIPFLTTDTFKGVNIGGERYYDGGFSNISFVNFKNDIPQLVFNTWDVEYSLSKTFSFKDKFPEYIILKGTIEFEKFINNIGEKNFEENKLFPIKWIESLKNIKKYKRENSNLVKLSKKNSNSHIETIKSEQMLKSSYGHNHIAEYNDFKKKSKINNQMQKIITIFFLTLAELFSMLLKK